MLVLLAAPLVLVNVAVRKLGGDVHPLAVRWWPERLHALAALARHRLTCRCADDPQALLRTAAARHGLPGQLVLAVARVESDFVHTRISGTGAMGLMQLMPDTARELAVEDPFDVAQNAEGGARFLKQLLRAYRGDVRRAVAAYNAGPGRVTARGSLAGIPEETRSYVSRVVSRL